MNQAVQQLTVYLTGGESLAFSGELDVDLSPAGLDIETPDGEIWCFPLSSIAYYHIIPQAEEQ
jgi:hypothetical protein